jgi:hypothetical protein
MANRLAMVFCVHHKPWLIMSTLITALAQDYQDADFYFVYNVGDGGQGRSVANGQLSPFDERVREVCRLNRTTIFELEYENDDTLDSGAWYKFIREGRWKAYDWVLFVGEGTLFARPTLVSAMVSLASSERGAHVIASGHEKRRLPKNVMLNYKERTENPSNADRLHDRAIAQAFEIFSRDPSFRRLFDAWGSDFVAQTQYHVPSSGPPSPLLRRFRSAWMRRLGSPSEGGAFRQLPWSIESLMARRHVSRPMDTPATTAADIYVDGALRPADSLGNIVRIGDVGFHQVQGPEWFGCATNHLMSRTCLERFSAKLEEFQIYDVLDLPFAGTPLEVIWGFVPAWLGFDKWFTDGFHRVRKDFVTYRREDYPPEMATYINRYYRGSLAIGWRGDYLKVLAVEPRLDRLREQLPAVYFDPPPASDVRANLERPV